MHLHGYNFYVVGSGTGNYNSTKDTPGYNLVDPPEMNTVGVPKNGWVAIRFRADNPGECLIHDSTMQIRSIINSKKYTT